MYRLFSILTLIVSTVSTIVSDSGCNCLTNGTCATKMDWTGQVSKWCATDGSCGTNQAGFGWVDSCATAGFPSVNLTAPVYLEWDQANYTYYTGQTLTVNWTSQNIVSDLVKITYQGSTLRTLTTGVNVTNGNYSVRLSDSGTSLATNVPLVLTDVSAPAISANSSQLLTILQSKISYVNVYNGPTLVTNGNSFPCDNRNLTIQWRGLGQAGVGIASVTIRSGGGGGGGGTTVGTPVTGLIAQGNMTVNYTLPRSFVPNGFTTYSAQISVQSPGIGVAPYTLNSLSFSLTAAPSVSPSSTPSSTPTPSISVGSTSSTTPSTSPTPTQTPSPSLSTGATASNTPTISLTPSQTPSQTPSPSQTPTLTPTQTPPPDLAALGRAAAASSLNTLQTIIGASIGGALFVCLVGGVSYKLYQRKQLHERRKRRLGNTRTYEDDRTVVYGITREQQFTNVRAYRSSQSKRVV